MPPDRLSIAVPDGADIERPQPAVACPSCAGKPQLVAFSRETREQYYSCAACRHLLHVRQSPTKGKP